MPQGQVAGRQARFGQVVAFPAFRWVWAIRVVGRPLPAAPWGLAGPLGAVVDSRLALGGSQSRRAARETLAVRVVPSGNDDFGKREGPPHPLSFTVAPFRSWRGSKCAVGGPQGTRVRSGDKQSRRQNASQCGRVDLARLPICMAAESAPVGPLPISPSIASVVAFLSYWGARAFHRFETSRPLRKALHAKLLATPRLRFLPARRLRFGPTRIG